MSASDRETPSDTNWPTPAESAMKQTSKTSAEVDAQMAPAPSSQTQDGIEGAAAGTADRERRIREAAYSAYERRGFAAGNAIDDWLEAEKSVDAPCS